jgi:hypothetical protein
VRQGVSSAARDTGSSVVRTATRQLAATAGNQVLKAAVDRAVVMVDQAADRLDAVAARPARSPGGSDGGKPPGRPAVPGNEPRPRSALRVQAGAAFNFLVHRAVLLLRLVQRLVRQLLAALARRLRRSDESVPDERPSGVSKARRSATGAGRGARSPDGTGEATRSSQPRRRPRAGTAAAPRVRRVAGDPAGRDGDDG